MRRIMGPMISGGRRAICNEVDDDEIMVEVVVDVDDLDRMRPLMPVWW